MGDIPWRSNERTRETALKVSDPASYDLTYEKEKAKVVGRLGPVAGQGFAGLQVFGLDLIAVGGEDEFGLGAGGGGAGAQGGQGGAGVARLHDGKVNIERLQ